MGTPTFLLALLLSLVSFSKKKYYKRKMKKMRCALDNEAQEYSKLLVKGE